MRQADQQTITKSYDKALLAYKLAWSLGSSLSLNFGLWQPETKTLAQAHANLYAKLAKMGGIRKEDVVLDAGCGVGGAARFLHQRLACRVIGVNISKQQLAMAKKYCRGMGGVEFLATDFCRIPLADASVTVVWALESLFHMADKTPFFKEAHRLLPKGSRLLIADYFLTKPYQKYSQAEAELLTDWQQGFLIGKLETLNDYQKTLANYGFEPIEQINISLKVAKSAQILSRWGKMGMFLLYPFHRFKIPLPFLPINYPKARAIVAQNQALEQGLWQYHILSFRKI